MIKYDLPEFTQVEALTPYYIVLESVSSNVSKVVHVINMGHTEEVKMGRGHDTDVRITDISVSRLHAYIRKSFKGFYYLEDNASKFGTLALI